MLIQVTLQKCRLVQIEGILLHKLSIIQRLKFVFNIIIENIVEKEKHFFYQGG